MRCNDEGVAIIKKYEGCSLKCYLDPIGILVSFVYNIGSGNFQSSTLRQKLRRKDYAKAALEFPKWRRANGQILRGLVNRRKKEKELFLKS